jgi:hypothetical protein
MTLTWTTSDRDAVAVFAVNLSEQVAKSQTPDGLLGLQGLDPDRAELFPVRDLEGVGLTGYLTEGLGLAEAEVDADKARLSALDGYVLILPATALPALPMTVPHTPHLTLIGTYHVPPMEIPLAPLTSAAATGGLGGPQATDTAPSLRLGPLLIAFAGLILLGGLAIVIGLLR